MRTLSLALQLGAVLAVLLFSDRALGQGCDLGISTGPVCWDKNNNPTANGAWCGGFYAAPPPNQCQYCYQGSGVCPAGSTRGTLTTANWGFDESCCPECDCENNDDCPGLEVCDPRTCECVPGSPIIVDTAGHGFHLTSADSGVTFDILGNGHSAKIAWTAANAGNAFLALDRNHNGMIDSGKELFGNRTEQPPSADRNGFLALAEFDKPKNGGNGDGIIDKRDAVFSHLLLWIDENHDGVSQPNELHALPELGVFSLGLHYRDAHRTDEYGNWFHYWAGVNPDPRDGESTDGRVTYDVFFEVAKNQRGGAASTALSRVQKFGRRDQWQISLPGGTYSNGFLYDDVASALAHAKKTRCPAKHDQRRSGGE
jgi:hypothetical protein